MRVAYVNKLSFPQKGGLSFVSVIVTVTLAVPVSLLITYDAS